MPEVKIKKIRVLTISKPYVASSYREKLRILAKDPRFEVGLITPQIWDNTKYQPSDLDTYWTKQLPIYLNGKNHFFFFRGLLKAIKEFRPDILNVEEEHYSFVTFQCYFFAWLLKIKPTFYTWQNIYKKYPFPFCAFEQFVFKKSSLGFAGNAEAEQVLRNKGFTGPIAVIPQMGANIRAKDADEFLKKRGSRSEFVVLYAGRLVVEKGLEDFLRAISLLSDLPVRAVIIGSGPEELSLKLKAKELGIEGRVRFEPPVASNEMDKFYHKADFLCLPSLTRANWKEQFGRVLVEAMAEGVIPIGSSSGEIPTVIGDAGAVFSEGNSPELAQAIRSLISLPIDEYKNLQMKAFNRAKEHFSNQVIAEKFADAFLKIFKN